MNNEELLFKGFKENDFVINENLNEVNKDNNIKLKEVLDYYENYKISSKKDDIIQLEKINENEIGINNQQYLNDFDKAKKMNERFNIIEYLYKREYIKGIGKKEDNYNKQLKKF